MPRGAPRGSPAPARVPTPRGCPLLPSPLRSPPAGFRTAPADFSRERLTECSISHLRRWRGRHGLYPTPQLTDQTNQRSTNATHVPCLHARDYIVLAVQILSQQRYTERTGQFAAPGALPLGVVAWISAWRLPASLAQGKLVPSMRSCAGGCGRGAGTSDGWRCLRCWPSASASSRCNIGSAAAVQPPALAAPALSRFWPSG